MSVLDLSLVKAPYGKGSDSPATLNGVHFRIDPSGTSLPIRAKMSKTYTIGGMVLQVYGVTWGDLTITGQFGLGGWREQRTFLDRMVSLGRSQSMQRAPTYASQNFTPGQPFRFTWPLLGWDFLCYLKAYTSPDGPQAVRLSNTVINPKYTLTLFVVTDNNTLTTTAQNAYISRLAGGLGFMWDSQTLSYSGYQQDQYNAPISSPNIQAYVNNLNGSGETVAKSKMTAAPLNLSGPVVVPNPNGSTSAVGSFGKSVVAPAVGAISSPNDFSAVLLQRLGIVPGTWAVGTPEANIDILLLNAWQAGEHQWQAYVPAFTPPQMHNPLNIHAKAFGFGYVNNIDGNSATGSFPTWADGVEAVVWALQQSHQDIISALQQASPSQFFTAVQGWNPTNGSYSSYIQSFYKGPNA